MDKLIAIISDATGETADRLLQSMLIQFDDHSATVLRFGNVRSAGEMDRAIDAIKQRNSAANASVLVCTTLLDPAMGERIAAEAETNGWQHVDMIGSLVGKLEGFFGTRRAQEPGKRHQRDHQVDRVAAIEYTVKHDDGMGRRSLSQADIVLIGLSCTAKTPVAMYLATKGYRVANIPYVDGLEVDLSGLDEEIHPRVVALYVHEDALSALRKQKLNQLGSKIQTSYAEASSVREEVQRAKKLFAQRGWPTVDVTGLSVEEIAVHVEERLL